MVHYWMFWEVSAKFARQIFCLGYLGVALGFTRESMAVYREILPLVTQKKRLRALPVHVFSVFMQQSESFR